MTRILLALSLVSSLSYAGILASFKMDASSTNLTNAYTLTGESQVAVGQKYVSKVCAFNTSAKDVAINVDDGTATVLPINGVKELYLPAGIGGCVATDPRRTVAVYLRLVSGGPMVTGVIYGDLRDIDK